MKTLIYALLLASSLFGQQPGPSAFQKFLFMPYQVMERSDWYYIPMGYGLFSDNQISQTKNDFENLAAAEPAFSLRYRKGEREMSGWTEEYADAKRVGQELDEFLKSEEGQIALRILKLRNSLIEIANDTYRRLPRAEPLDDAGRPYPLPFVELNRSYYLTPNGFCSLGHAQGSTFKPEDTFSFVLSVPKERRPSILSDTRKALKEISGQYDPAVHES